MTSRLKWINNELNRIRHGELSGCYCTVNNGEIKIIKQNNEFLTADGFLKEIDDKKLELEELLEKFTIKQLCDNLAAVPLKGVTEPVDKDRVPYFRIVTHMLNIFRDGITNHESSLFNIFEKVLDHIDPTKETTEDKRTIFSDNIIKAIYNASIYFNGWTVKAIGVSDNKEMQSRLFEILLKSLATRTIQKLSG